MAGFPTSINYILSIGVQISTAIQYDDGFQCRVLYSAASCPITAVLQWYGYAERLCRFRCYLGKQSKLQLRKCGSTHGNAVWSDIDPLVRNFLDEPTPSLVTSNGLCPLGHSPESTTMRTPILSIPLPSEWCRVTLLLWVGDSENLSLGPWQLNYDIHSEPIRGLPTQFLIFDFSNAPPSLSCISTLA